MPSKRWIRLRKRIFINRLVPNRMNAARSYINAVQLSSEHLSYAKNARSEAIENHETAVTQGNNLRDIIQQSNQAFTGCSVNVRNIDDMQIIERFAARGWRGVVCYPRNDSALEPVARGIRDFYQDDWIVSRNDPTSSSSAGSPVQFFDSLPPDRLARYVGRGDSTSSSDE